MRFHVIGMPHTHTTKDFSTCAYTQKVRGFCNMMMNLGHVVYLYSGEKNDARCTEHYTCITDIARLSLVGAKHYVEAAFNGPQWDYFNAEAIARMKKTVMPRDFICLIMGTAQKPIADAFPTNMSVEFGVGYDGWFSMYKVFESYTWMHTCYGNRAKNTFEANGSAWDEVIPNYLHISDFLFEEKKDDYYLYLGRFVDRKGYQIAIDACMRKNAKLILAGPPPLMNTTYGDYVGEVGPVERAKLLSKARAVFVPTQYIEPFGTVAIEAMACGTPVITSDWGAFVETVPSNVGVRCKVMQDYLDAIETVKSLDPNVILKWSYQFAQENIAPRYEKYFRRLETMWGKGWYELRENAA